MAQSLWGYSPSWFSQGHTQRTSRPSDGADFFLLTFLPQLQSHLIPGLNLAAVGLFPASSSAVPPPPSSVTGAAPYSSFMVGARSYYRGHLGLFMASLKGSYSLWEPDAWEFAGREKGGLGMLLLHCSQPPLTLQNVCPKEGNLGFCQGCWGHASSSLLFLFPGFFSPAGHRGR